MRRWISVAAAVAVTSFFAADARADDVSACVGAFDGAQKAASVGKILTARDLLEVCAGPTCPGPLRADCMQRREEIERLVPTAAFVVRDTLGNDVESQIAVDGAAVATLGRAIPLEPGAHIVSFTTADGKRHDQRIVAAEGEKARVVVLHTGGAPGPSTAQPERAPEEPHSNAVPWVLLGTGAGLVLVGGALAFAASVDWSDTKQSYQATFDLCRDEVCRSNAITGYNDAKDRTVVREGVALGMVTVGLIAGSVGAALLATSTSRSSSHATLVPLIGTTNGAALSGSF